MTANINNDKCLFAILFVYFYLISDLLKDFVKDFVQLFLIGIKKFSYVIVTETVIFDLSFKLIDISANLM